MKPRNRIVVFLDCVLFLCIAVVSDTLTKAERYNRQKAMLKKNVLVEARNIARNTPVSPGDTISNRTARECEVTV